MVIFSMKVHVVADLAFLEVEQGGCMSLACLMFDLPFLVQAFVGHWAHSQLGWQILLLEVHYLFVLWFLHFC